MKKEIIIVIIIIIFIVIGHIFTQDYTKKVFSEIGEDLKEIKTSISDETINNVELQTKIDAVQKKWNEKYDMLAYYLEHDELEKVQTQLIGIKANIETEEYERCVEMIKTCLFVLKHIEDKDSLKFVNIF